MNIQWNRLPNMVLEEEPDAVALDDRGGFYWAKGGIITRNGLTNGNRSSFQWSSSTRERAIRISAAPNGKLLAVTCHYALRVFTRKGGLVAADELGGFTSVPVPAFSPDSKNMILFSCDEKGCGFLYEYRENEQLIRKQPAWIRGTTTGFWRNNHCVVAGGMGGLTMYKRTERGGWERVWIQEDLQAHVAGIDRRRIVELDLNQNTLYSIRDKEGGTLRVQKSNWVEQELNIGNVFNTYGGGGMIFVGTEDEKEKRILVYNRGHFQVILSGAYAHAANSPNRKKILLREGKSIWILDAPK